MDVFFICVRPHWKAEIVLTETVLIKELTIIFIIFPAGYLSHYRQSYV